MKRLIVFILLIFLACPAFGQSNTETEYYRAMGGHMQATKHLLVCAADGSFSVTDATTRDISGVVILVVVSHSYTTDPDADYDLDITDTITGENIMGTQLDSIAGTTASYAYAPQINGTDTKYPVVGDLTFAIANQGTANAGLYVTIIYWSDRS